MTNRVALLVEQAMIDTEPEAPLFVFECDIYAPHFYCNPVTCIEAAMQILDSRNFNCYCGKDHN